MIRFITWLFGQSAQTRGVNSPAINMSGPGGVTVTYGEDAETAERRHYETRQGIQALPEAVTMQVMAALRESGVIPRAEAEGLAERTVLTLARHLRPEEVHDLDHAVRETEHSVKIALATIHRGERPASSEDAFVDGVLAEVAQRTREGALDRAAQAVDGALMELETREAEQRDALRRARATLLEAGINQDLLRPRCLRRGTTRGGAGHAGDTGRPWRLDVELPHTSGCVLQGRLRQGPQPLAGGRCCAGPLHAGDRRDS